MGVLQLVWSHRTGWQRSSSEQFNLDLVLYFGTREALACGARYHELRSMFPDAKILGCSTGGQIIGDEVKDDEVTAIGLCFAATKLQMACETVGGASDSFECGAAIARSLRAEDLSGIFVLSDGLNVNGSELVRGISSVIGKHIPLTGGLAGDGAQFGETLVGGDRAVQALGCTEMQGFLLCRPLALPEIERFFANAKAEPMRARAAVA